MTTLAPNPQTPAEQHEGIYTYDQLTREFPDSNLPMELWDGKIITAPAPFYPHQKLATMLSSKLNLFVEERDLGEVLSAPFDMVLSPHIVVQPDILFLSKDRLSLLKDVLRGPADFVIEVISPGSRIRDRIEKLDLYSQYEIKEYWIVDPDARTIEVFVAEGLLLTLVQRAGSGNKAVSKLLPGFEVDIDKLWAKMARP